MKNREPQTPNSRNGKKEVLNLLETGDLTIEELYEIIEEQNKIRTETQNMACAALEHQSEKHFSFSEAVKLLERKLDLEAARTDAIKSHGRWGLSDSLVSANVIKKASKYGNLFDQVTVNGNDIHRVLQNLEDGKKVIPIFDAGGITPDKLFSTLFIQAGITYFTNSYAFKNLAKMRRIDPKDIPDLANLAKKPFEQQISAFKIAYKKAEPIQPTGPRLTFAYDNKNTYNYKSSAEEIQAFTKDKISFIDPCAEMIRYRMQMDAGLCKIAEGLDKFNNMSHKDYRAFLNQAFADGSIDQYMTSNGNGNINRFPNYAFENGGILNFLFLSNLRAICLSSQSPDYAVDFLGNQISLG